MILDEGKIMRILEILSCIIEKLQQLIDFLTKRCSFF
jgi:hypothetical protein